MRRIGEPARARLRRPCHIEPSCSETLSKRLPEQMYHGPERIISGLARGAGVIPCLPSAKDLAELTYSHVPFAGRGGPPTRPAET